MQVFYFVIILTVVLEFKAIWRWCEKLQFENGFEAETAATIITKENTCRTY